MRLRRGGTVRSCRFALPHVALDPLSVTFRWVGAQAKSGEWSSQQTRIRVSTMTIATIILVAVVVAATTGLCAFLVVWLAD